MEALLLACGPALHRVVLREVQPQCCLLVGIQRKQMQVVVPHSGASVYLQMWVLKSQPWLLYILKFALKGCSGAEETGSGGEGCCGEQGGGL